MKYINKPSFPNEYAALWYVISCLLQNQDVLGKDDLWNININITNKTEAVEIILAAKKGSCHPNSEIQ